MQNYYGWESYDMADYVDIFEVVENVLVHTMEGNNGDVCAEQRYTLGSAPV